MRIWHPRNYGLSLGILVISFLQSCSNSNYRETQTLSVQERSVANPPSMVEKLWLARTHYDQDRRLIVPKVGGSRWGAVQEYTADGNLVYRDWWVRNLKVEDLEAAPSTEIQVVQEEDTNLRPPVLGISGMNTDTTNTADDAAISTPETNEVVFPSPANSGEVDPFAPVPEAGTETITPETNEVDPFAPLPSVETEQSGSDKAAEADPFAPLPSPF